MQAENINYIRFTVVSPEYVRKLSVAKIIVPDTYNDEGYPIDGGLVDQRLGVIDPGLKCKTCGGRSKTCPGHFGHIELVRPVIHPEFAKTIYMLLQSTCESCKRILLNDNEITSLSEKIRNFISNEEDYEYEDILESRMVSKKTKNIKLCPHCNTKQRKIKLERPTFFSIDGIQLKADEIRDWLSKIPDSDLKLLSIDPATTRPENFVLINLLIPPVNVRPSITLESGERSEDDLTHKLVDIIRINQRLEQDIDAGAPQIIIDDLWELLQYQVTTYFNNETIGVPVARHRSTRPLKTLAQRLKGKEGRLRYNLSGKRVNFSARTVISCDSTLSINQIGVPQKIAESLTVPLYATQWNIEYAKKFIENTQYPTALNYISKQGIRKRITDTNREDILKALEPGDIIERQLIDGDIVLFNRQPTLHRVSIMAHEVKVFPGRTFRLNSAATTPYNADFDGDEMNVHVPQSLEAQAEARYLMQPKDLILSARNGEPIMYLKEDELVGIYLLTQDNVEFSKQEASKILSSIGIYEFPEPNKKTGKFSGKAIFSMILPKEMNFEYKNKNEEIVIKNGKITSSGVIGEKIVNEQLITNIFSKFGSQEAMNFITNASKISLITAYQFGISIGISDYYINGIMEEKDRIMQETEKKAYELLENYRSGNLEPLPGYTLKESYNSTNIMELTMVRNIAANSIKKYLTPENDAYLMVLAKARGNIFNFVQTSMFLGQQAVRGKAPSRGYKNRILPYFRRSDESIVSKGFVKSSYSDGLKLVEYYMHAMGARDSAMNKSLVTAVSGYMQRRLVNALQDIYVDQDLSVKDASGSLIQTQYGGDSLDPMYEKLQE